MTVTGQLAWLMLVRVIMRMEHMSGFVLRCGMLRCGMLHCGMLRCSILRRGIGPVEFLDMILNNYEEY